MGRWKTDEAKDMYVLETECNRLSVTKYLGTVEPRYFEVPREMEKSSK